MITTVAAASLLAGAAHATTACGLTDIVPNAEACTGFYAGNLLSGSPADIAAQQAALATLGFAWDGNVANVEIISPLGGSHTVDFAHLLVGTTFIGLHFGGGVGGPGNATAFYKIDAGAGLDQIALNYNASSNAWLYSTGGGSVPEPAVWSMMIMGFGLAGAAIRRRRAVGVLA